MDQSDGNVLAQSGVLTGRLGMTLSAAFSEPDVRDQGEDRRAGTAAGRARREATRSAVVVIAGEGAPFDGAEIVAGEE